MSYVTGFVIPVPADNKAAYVRMCERTATFFEEHGATRSVECWGERVPDGKVTDFRRAVRAEPGERIVFGWVEWPDRDTCEAAEAKMRDDERMRSENDPPFDGGRMIWGGFEIVLDSRSATAEA